MRGNAWIWQGVEDKLKTTAECLPVVDELDLRAYLEKVERTGRFVLTAWRGSKAIKPFAHFSFKTREKALAYLQTTAESLVLSQMMKAGRPKRWPHVADEVREIVKARYPGLSVRRGKGTASSWTDIGSKDGGMFTEQEQQALRDLGISFGGNFAVMDYADARDFVRRHRREQFRVVEAGA